MPEKFGMFPPKSDGPGERRERIATALLAGALATGATTLPPIFYVDTEGPTNSGYVPETWKEKAARMVKNSVKLADMLLEELEKAEYEYSKSLHCTCSEDAGGNVVPFDPKCPQHGKR